MPLHIVIHAALYKTVKSARICHIKASYPLEAKGVIHICMTTCFSHSS